MNASFLLFLKNAVFTLVVPGTVAGVVPWFIGRGRETAPLGYALIAVVLFVVGAAIYLWCVWDFATFGRGTPAPIDAPKKLVVRGLYRYVRNPMYVGMFLVLLGWLVLFQTIAILLYLVCWATVVHLFVVFYEEPRLRKLFGDDYEKYRYTTGRWLPFTSRR